MDHQQKHWHWIVKNEVVVYHSFCSFALEYRPSLLKSLQIHHLKMKLHSYLFVFQVITHYVEPVIIEVQSFSHQQKRNVLRTTVKSAIDDAETFWRAFEENNYHIEGLDREIVKPRRTEKRRSEGMQTMEQYNAKRAERSNHKLEQLQELLESNPKMKRLN